VEQKYNGFKEYEKKLIEGKEENLHKINEKINSTKKAYDLFGNILELYVPKAIDSLGKLINSHPPINFKKK
jgi:hypothetical protein